MKKQEARKEKVFFKRWFCRHNYQPAPDLRAFFGIIQCVKCGNWSNLPADQMTTTEIKFPPIEV